MMNASRSELTRRAFVLTEEDLRALSGVLGAIGATRFQLHCSDRLSRAA